jgi:hypothetical protein
MTSVVRGYEWPLVVLGLWCGAMWTAASAYWLILTDQGPISVSSPLDVPFVVAVGPGIALAWLGERAVRSGVPLELAVVAEVLTIGVAITAVMIHLLRRSGA